MATRESVEQLLQQCNDAIQNAQDQYKESSLQEHYNNDNYTDALQQLEGAYHDIARLAPSANSQQREQLHRMRLRVQDQQNAMILQNR